MTVVEWIAEALLRLARGNTLVPELVRLACAQAGVRVADLALLVTNQPSPIWRGSSTRAPMRRPPCCAGRRTTCAEDRPAQLLQPRGPRDRWFVPGGQR